MRRSELILWQLWSENINAMYFLVDDNAALLIWDVRCSRTWNGNLPQTMYLSLSVGCGMRLHASFATHTLKIQEEVYFPPQCGVLYRGSFNLKPCFRIYYIYIYICVCRVVFIVNLHRFPEEFVLCAENKLSFYNWKYRQGFLQRFHAVRSKPESWLLFNYHHMCNTNWALSGCTQVLKTIKWRNIHLFYGIFCSSLCTNWCVHTWTPS